MGVVGLWVKALVVFRRNFLLCGHLCKNDYRSLIIIYFLKIVIISNASGNLKIYMYLSLFTFSLRHFYLLNWIFFMKFTPIISIFRFIVYCNSAPAVMQFACSIKFKNKNHSFMKKGQIQIILIPGSFDIDDNF